MFMNMKNLLLMSITLALSACGGTTTQNQNEAASPQTAPASNAASPYPSIPADGNYIGRGKVTKINLKVGSVEIDHQDIPGMMPAMRMEFNVKDKALLNGLQVGDDVKFVIEYKHPTETITAIKKAL
jgi:Cu/Ag efflux protein CusF